MLAKKKTTKKKQQNAQPVPVWANVSCWKVEWVCAWNKQCRLTISTDFSSTSRNTVRRDPLAAAPKLHTCQGPVGIRNVLLARGKGEGAFRHGNRSCAALGFVGKRVTCFMLWKPEAIHVDVLGWGSGKMQWPTSTRTIAMALFLLLKQKLKTTSTDQLFCLPFNCSFQGNYQFGLLALSPLHFWRLYNLPITRQMFLKLKWFFT